MGYNILWRIFEETGDIEDYLEYVNNGEYYNNYDPLFSREDKELEIAFGAE